MSFFHCFAWSNSFLKCISAKFIQQQIERAKAGGTEAQKAEYTELQRESEEEKVTFSLGITKPKEEPISNK